MTLNDYQQIADSTAVYPSKGENLSYPVLGLVSEVGEICDKLKKAQRDSGLSWKDLVTDPVTRSGLLFELGDVLWYVAAVATELGVTLDSVAEANVLKLRTRQARRTLHGSGDDR